MVGLQKMKKTLASPIFKVVTLLLFSTLVVISAAVSIGERQGFLQRKYHLIAPFKNIEGMGEGTQVWMSGYPIGIVDDISFDETLPYIHLQIEKRYQDFIANNSIATISNTGLVGEKRIEIIPGNNSKLLLNGDTIRTHSASQPEDILFHVSGIIYEVNASVSSLYASVKKVENSSGSLGKFIDDPRFQTSLDTLLLKITSIEDQIVRKEGYAHAFFFDSFLYDSLSSALININSVLVATQNDRGKFNKLLSDKDSYQGLLKTIADINRYLCYIEQGTVASNASSEEQNSMDKYLKYLVSIDTFINKVKRNPEKYFKIKPF